MSPEQNNRCRVWSAPLLGLFAWAFVVGSFQGVAQAGGLERVLVLGARAVASGATPLPRKLLETMDSATVERLGQVGIPTLRLGRGEGAGCEPEDYDCLVRGSRQAVELVLDVALQRNDESNYYLTVVLYDVRNPAETGRQQFPFVTTADSRTAPREHEQSVVAKAVSMLGSLLDTRRPSGPSAHSNSSDKTTFTLKVLVDGVGRVESEAPASAIDCPGGPCEVTIPAKGAAPIVLLPRPRSPSTFLGWGNNLCIPSPGNSWGCSLQLTGDVAVTARFGRSLGRKIAVGTFLLGTVVTGVAAIALRAMNGRVIDCPDGPAGNMGCVDNTIFNAAMTAGASGAFALGAVLSWWLPVASENRP